MHFSVFEYNLQCGTIFETGSQNLIAWKSVKPEAHFLHEKIPLIYEISSQFPLIEE